MKLREVKTFFKFSSTTLSYQNTKNIWINLFAKAFVDLWNCYVIVTERRSITFYCLLVSATLARIKVLELFIFDWSTTFCGRNDISRMGFCNFGCMDLETFKTKFNEWKCDSIQCLHKVYNTLKFSEHIIHINLILEINSQCLIWL